MRILIVTPAPSGSRKGNRITAVRWARFLRHLGHRVQIDQDFRRNRCDLLIALHARRSYPAMAKFRKQHPDRPLIVALTGTDLYNDIHSDIEARNALHLADRLVVLQPKAIEELPSALRAKTRVILQSAVPPRGEIPKRERSFDVCVIGHLRPVKDPFRTALAVRSVPDGSRIRVLHLGAALDENMRRMAVEEMRRNLRYRWLGEKPRWQVRRILAGCHLLVLSSLMEGGANVIAEAVVAGVPVLASKISGTVGQLGEAYPGYFPTEDDQKLRQLLVEAESNPAFLQQLQEWVERLKPKFAPEHELSAWQRLLEELA